MKIKDMFKDNKGKIAIVQFPNTPLLGFIVFSLMALWIPLAEVGYWGGTLCLLYWSYLEITDGVSPFRSLLGLCVMLFLVVSRVNTVLSR